MIENRLVIACLVMGVLVGCQKQRATLRMTPMAEVPPLVATAATADAGVVEAPHTDGSAADPAQPRYLIAGVVAEPLAELAIRHAGEIGPQGASLARENAPGLLREPPDPQPRTSPAVKPVAGSAAPVPPATQPAEPPAVMQIAAVSLPLFSDHVSQGFRTQSALSFRVAGRWVAEDAWSNFGAGLLGDNGSSLVSNNSGSLVSNNSGSLVSNNSSSVVSNNSSSLVSNGSVRSAFRNLLSLVSRGAIKVNDSACQILTDPGAIASDGTFRFVQLQRAPISKWLLVQADDKVHDTKRTYMALLPLPEPGQNAWVELTPATTLIAKVYLSKIGLCAGGSSGTSSLTPADLDKALEAVEGHMGPAAMVAAVTLDADQVSKVFEAMVNSSRVLRAELPTAVSDLAQAQPGPSRSGRGGGAPVVPAGPPGVQVNLSFSSHFSVTRPAGDAVRGLDLGANAAGARFQSLGGLALGADGTVFACDPAGNQVRALPPAGPTLRLAGAPDGASGAGPDEVVASSALLSKPTGLVRLPATGQLIFCETGANIVRGFVPGGRIHRLAGGGANAADDVPTATNAALSQPTGLAVDSAGVMYFTEAGNGRIRRLARDGRLTTVATLAPGSVGPIAVSVDGTRIWVGIDDTVRLIRPDDAVPLDPTPVYQSAGTLIRQLAFDESRLLYLAESAADGLSASRILRLPLDTLGAASLGRSAEAIAGNGTAGVVAADFAMPAIGVPNALSLRLPGSGLGGLLIDLRNAAVVGTRAGSIFVGTTYSDGVDGGFGQLLKLAPEE